MSEVTRILSAIEHGDLHAAEQLLPLVYDELRKLAAQLQISPRTADAWWSYAKAWFQAALQEPGDDS